MPEKIVFIVLLGLFIRSDGQIVQNGQCDPNINLANNFNVLNFGGIWYEHGRTANPTQGGDCSYVDIEIDRDIDPDIDTDDTDEDTDTDNTTYIHTFYNRAVDDNFLKELRGTFTVDNSDVTSPRLSVNLIEGNTTTSLDLYVLATDNNQDLYALIYGCNDISTTQREIYLWRLERNLSPNALVDSFVQNSINNLFGISLSDLESVDHSERACYELPVIEEGAAIELPGQCDEDIAAVPNFNLIGFSGIWHEIASYENENAVGNCPRSDYELVGSTFNVINTYVVNQTLLTVDGAASLISSDGSGRLEVTVEVSSGALETYELFVLGTDYSSYALTYACENIDNTTKRVYSWILGRSRDLGNATNAVNDLVDSFLDLNYAYYQDAARTDLDCFFYPDPIPGTPVTFRGRCDLDIPVQTDFDVERYMGLWHDIESYPSVFQQGTCNNAYYGLDGSVVNVLNTQVLDQTLDSINGVARIASNDTTGKLMVEFPIVGTNLTVETDYWVLATDYDSYALVYTCVQNGDDNRTVWSWKLSRTKQMPVNVTSEITAVVNSIPVLDQRYYESKDQTEEGCFYFPEPETGVPVVFPGYCDLNVPVVDNFNYTSFAGTWYEIQSYPKDFQSGQCIDHEWTLGTANTFSLESSSIVDQFLQVISSSVSSTDDSSRFVVTVGSQTMPVWILATDYDEFALAYSCVNLEHRPDFRAIHSWKLSRTRSLSEAANTAIDAAIDNVVVLANDYFEPVSHSDEDCFFLPELEAGEPIILPGQCDPDLNVVTNFSASDYEGLWHLIESYPSDLQFGTCNDANYTIQDGVVFVYNTQVVNQSLDTLSATAVLIESEDGSAKLNVTFPGLPPVESWILSTDYTSYSFVYSCENINSEQRRVWSWKLSREKSLTSDAIDAINEVISNVNVLNQRYYEVIDNSDDACFYFPELDGNPVVFRGQCDLTIPVVDNFNISEYMGLWHHVQSYPSELQQGTCNNAYYSLNSGNIDITTTQVIDERLDTVYGIANVDPENDAKLVVSFPILDTNLTTSTNYWVLATDYTTYALVYSCKNLDSDHREVWSWKISRNKQLTAADEASIDAVVNTIPVLDQRYYESKDQSEVGCFYFPEPVPGQPVVFPGQCDQNIAVSSNFSLELFQGTWYEVESYPQDFRSGQCVSHDFTGTSSWWGIETSVVNNQALVISSSNVTFTDSNTDAKMSILSANGETIPFWVLATNYDDYAIAYGCVNLVDRPDFRAIHSWKLSRTRTLSDASNAAIDSVLSEVQVLTNDYFEPVGQTDESCFYYPELLPNEPVVFVGQCDVNIPVVNNFDAERFSGRWYDIESYFDDFDGDCNDGRFEFTNNGYDVTLTQVSGETLETTTSRATIAVDGSGKLTVNTDNGDLEYWVLSTDYDNYALMYLCNNLDTESRRVRSWKISKTRSLNNQSLSAIDDVVDGIDVLDARYFNIRDHSAEGCFYFPVHVPGQVVRFRGDCDETIQVVQDFDVERYLGRWYDIESYPQTFQDGTCAQAYYGEADEGVNVYNQQVLNQRLDTINGTAVLATNDTSAKLLVTFTIPGTDITTTSPYWVLDTDYDNYALVYSCSPHDDEYVSIGSWKLSRYQELLNESISAIDNVINNVTVLRQEYFDETGHTEDDCFFYPENYGGPVILDGQCPSANETDVVSDFNLAAFAGTWHEISRFPSELQTGECANSQLTSSGQNSFSLSQNLVFNERLNTVTGTAQASTDGRGILSATVSGEGVTTSMDYYILATDYINYALVYSCKNINENQKQIYSWKLSKSQAGLSEAANAAIDEIVDANIDLWGGYYEDTDQSNDGCFHYPEFDPLPDVIVLPGPCDERIVGKAGFDAVAYLGRWFEISRYPQPFQYGTCSQAQYSTDNDGNIVVSNNQVINQTLDVTIGSASVASTDGSGLLEVTFVVDGVTNVANYYVLETDYTSFALVYSCRNLADGNRQVSSWKLSRSTTLGDQTNTIINNFIANTQGLIEDYYVPTDLSDDDCFYIPEVVEDEAPVFRGACEDVTGVPNFDFQRFQGWWHEIERYPVDGSIGECISSDYQQLGNSFWVTDTDVVGLAGNPNTVTVSADTNGKITRTYPDGRVIESWVLATDYFMYALIYSCENFIDANGDQLRRVWSAKHSMRRLLLPTDHAIMDPIIEENPVLYPEFYRTVDQSDSACFHYPDPELFQEGRVVLPGQCRVNIPTQTQFDLDAFTGTWYQIQRYPTTDISEASTCIGTRFTLNAETNELAVLNWEVNGGNLTTTEGIAVPHHQDARFEVTVTNSEGVNVTKTLQILGTDYNVYALVLTCENINTFQREVVSYKFSRTRNLPISAVNPIFALTQLHEELNEVYYITVPQDEECEEPSASTLVKSSVIVLLICAVWQMIL